MEPAGHHFSVLFSRVSKQPLSKAVSRPAAEFSDWIPNYANTDKRPLLHPGNTCMPLLGNGCGSFFTKRLLPITYVRESPKPRRWIQHGENDRRCADSQRVFQLRQAPGKKPAAFPVKIGVLQGIRPNGITNEQQRAVIE